MIFPGFPGVLSFFPGFPGRVGTLHKVSTCVSSDDHQMSLAEGLYSEVQYNTGNGHMGTPLNKQTPAKTLPSRNFVYKR